MNTEEILNMPAGPEMDALIAEKVFGITNPDPTKCPYCGYEMWVGVARSRCSICGEWRYSAHKEYSADISAAWEVVEKLKPFKFEISRDNGGNIDCLIWLRETFTERHKPADVYGCESLPLAICRAALLTFN